MPSRQPKPKHLKFVFLRDLLSKLPVKDAILEGEIIHLDKYGVRQLNELLKRDGGHPICYAFDLLWLNGKDYRPFSLLEHKKRLERLVQASDIAELLYGRNSSRRFASETLKALTLRSSLERTRAAVGIG